jgi:hypothetical protein
MPWIWGDYQAGQNSSWTAGSAIDCASPHPLPGAKAGDTIPAPKH